LKAVIEGGLLGDGPDALAWSLLVENEVHLRGVVLAVPDDGGGRVWPSEPVYTTHPKGLSSMTLSMRFVNDVTLAMGTVRSRTAVLFTVYLHEVCHGWLLPACQAPGI
jgi:hypothetical protein